MALQIQLRRDSASQWSTNNPTLAEGEFGIEVESLTTPPLRFKVGDGVTNWNNLPYASVTGIAEKVNIFIATQDQASYTVPEEIIADDKLYEVKVNGIEWNSRTGQISFPQGNISIDFSTGVITFHRTLDEGDQVVIKYN